MKNQSFLLHRFLFDSISNHARRVHHCTSGSLHLLLNQLEVRSLGRLETEFADVVQNETYEHLVSFSFSGDVSSLESIGLDILSYPYGMIPDSKTEPEEKCRFWTPDTKRLKTSKGNWKKGGKDLGRSWKITGGPECNNSEGTNFSPFKVAGNIIPEIARAI